MRSLSFYSAHIVGNSKNFTLFKGIELSQFSFKRMRYLNWVKSSILFACRFYIYQYKFQLKKCFVQGKLVYNMKLMIAIINSRTFFIKAERYPRSMAYTDKANCIDTRHYIILSHHFNIIMILLEKSPNRLIFCI